MGGPLEEHVVRTFSIAGDPVLTTPHLILRQTAFGAPAPDMVEIVDLQVSPYGRLAPGQLEAYAANRGIRGCLLYAVPVAAVASV